MARRLVPTPGSTTATTMPGQRYLHRAGQHQAGTAHVERGDLVAQVDDAHVGRQGPDDRLEHPDELVLGAVVGEQGDRFECGHVGGAQPAWWVAGREEAVHVHRSEAVRLADAQRGQVAPT